MKRSIPSAPLVGKLLKLFCRRGAALPVFCHRPVGVVVEMQNGVSELLQKWNDLASFGRIIPNQLPCPHEIKEGIVVEDNATVALALLPLDERQHGAEIAITEKPVCESGPAAL